MGNKLCAISEKGKDAPKKNSHLLRLWAEIFEVRVEGDEVCWAKVSDDVVPVNITCIQDVPDTVFQITAYNRHVEKIFDVKLIQPGTNITQASECFVHWKDSRHDNEWGLNFTTPVDARRFRDCCMCDCSHEYNDMLFHNFAHVDEGEDGKPSIDEVQVRDEFVEWLRESKGNAEVHAEDWLRKKGLTFDEWLEHMATPGNKGDTLALYFLARFYDKQVAIIGKTTVYFTHDGPPDSDVEECDLVFVYLGQHVYRCTRPRPGGRPPLLTNPPPKRPAAPSADDLDADYVPPSDAADATVRRSTRNRPSAAAGAPGAPPPPDTSVSTAPTPAKKPRGRPLKPKPKSYTVATRVHGIKKAKKRVFHKKCGLCAKIFDSQKLLNDHTTNDHNNYRYYCPDRTCRKHYSSEAALKKHQKEHLPLPYPCDDCDRRFAFKSALQTHLLTHIEEGKIHCPYPRCHSVLKSDYEYRRHYQRHSVPNDKYTCDVCKRGFQEHRGLMQHSVKHSGELQYTCQYCGGRFMWRSSRRNHEVECRDEYESSLGSP